LGAAKPIVVVPIGWSIIVAVGAAQVLWIVIQKETWLALSTSPCKDIAS